ncbi:MAG: energy-coupling factor transporter transmembrane component T [Desulfobacterales bacterium]
MAELTPSALRRRPLRLDARLKLVLLCAASLVSLHLQIPGLLMLIALLTALAIACRAYFDLRLRDLRWVLWILVIVFAAHLLFTEGTPLVRLGPLAPAREGLREGAIACLRLTWVFMLGGLFIALTPSSEIKAGVQWFLKPIPGVPAERVGTMLGLVARFIPVIFEEAARTSDAQHARLANRRRNPVGRMAAFGQPLIRRVVQTADRLAVAMEARCYTGVRTEPDLNARGPDWLFFGIGLAALAAALAL